VGGSSFQEDKMRRVKLTSSVKMDTPLIVGDKDDILFVPDHVAEFAIRQRLGIYLEDEPKQGPTRAELEQQEAEIEAGTLKKIGEDDSQSDTDEEPAEPEEVKRPYGNAPKSAWARYAALVDPEMTEERAEGMTKADLLSRYGERL
jgi:hypothetical protein